MYNYVNRSKIGLVSTVFVECNGFFCRSVLQALSVPL